MSLFTETRGLGARGCRTHGFPLARELTSIYQQHSESDLGALAWFDALAAYKFAAITGFNLALHRRGRGEAASIRTVEGTEAKGSGF